MTLKRRDFLAGAGGLVAGSTVFPSRTEAEGLAPKPADGQNAAQYPATRVFNGPYRDDYLNQIAFPMGGLGAGMICLEGSGAFSKFSLWHRPNLKNMSMAFSAVSINGPVKTARVLEGPIPAWKRYVQFVPPYVDTGLLNPSLGLPRFHHASFEARFPFATIRLEDKDVPLGVKLTGWSPFSPGDADDASLPVVGVEYTFANRSQESIDAVFSFNAENFMGDPNVNRDPDSKSLNRVEPLVGGFQLYGSGAPDRPWDVGRFAAWVDDPSVNVNHAWFRGGGSSGFLQMAWNDIKSRACYERPPLRDASAPGASLFVPFTLAPRASKTIVLRFAWYVPRSNVFAPEDIATTGGAVHAKANLDTETYRPWYAGRFASIDEVVEYWNKQYQSLKRGSETFSRTLYDSTLPPEILEAVAANLTILKSPTILRQIDGRLWGWEGCYDSEGACHGIPAHVYGFGQAIAHLFPDLERGVRETQFGANQNEEGRQSDRAALPIRPLVAAEFDVLDPAFTFGEISLAYRDWRISGDTDWMRRWWPRIRACLDYCIKTLDPTHQGWIEEPSSALDGATWGDSAGRMMGYFGALKAAVVIGQGLGEPVDFYARLLHRGIPRLERELFNGEYFFQRVKWKNLRTPFPQQDLAYGLHYSPEALKLLETTGPFYQAGDACTSGAPGWLSWVCGIGDVGDRAKAASHTAAVHRYNFKTDLTDSANVCRYMLACGGESGLLNSSWPKGGEPPLPNAYAHEAGWTGVEYSVASYLIVLNKIEQGLEIVRAARQRYDGRIRNPFAEAEEGHWYARAMSSYALLQAFSGARFDAVDKILYLEPAVKGDFSCFLSTATGFGTVGVKSGKPFVEVVSGDIPYRQIKYTEV